MDNIFVLFRRGLFIKNDHHCLVPCPLAGNLSSASPKDMLTVFWEVDVLETYFSRQPLPLNQVWIGKHQWPAATSSWAVIRLVLEAGWWRRSDRMISTTAGVGNMADCCWTHCKTDSRAAQFGPQYFSLFSFYVIQPAFYSRTGQRWANCITF